MATACSPNWDKTLHGYLSQDVIPQSVNVGYLVIPFYSNWQTEVTEYLKAMSCKSLAHIKWNVDNKLPCLCWLGHKGRVLNLALSPDGRQFFSAAADGTACVWRSKDSEDTYQEQGTEKSDWYYLSIFAM